MHFHQKCIAPLTSVLRLTRVDMYHAVLYLRISILHSIVYSFRRSVGVPEREAAIHSDFQINIYPVSKQAGVYLVYTQHMPLFQRCIGNDLNSVLDVYKRQTIHLVFPESDSNKILYSITGSFIK